MGNKLEPEFWSRVLKEKGLESPGRDKAVEDTLLYIQNKKQAKDDTRREKTEKKQTRKKKK